MSEVSELEQTAVTTPADMLRIAVEQGADLDKMQQLMDLQERWDANQAKKAFHVALAAFKADPPEVIKDKENKQYDSMYVSLPNLVNTLSAALSKHNLDTRWEFVQPNGDITVTCILAHIQGHAETATLSAPPDDSGKKNTIQQIKSTTTYLKAATLEAVTGIASVEANKDDDGNSTAAAITAEQAEELKNLLKETGSDTKQFLKMCGGIASVDELPASKFKGAFRRLQAKQQLESLKE